MIKEKKALNMYEVKETLKGLKETDKTKDTEAYIKKFSSLSLEKARKLKGDLDSLNLIKLKETDIAKIVDILPENSIELNKIFTEISLDTDETTKILDSIKKNL